MQLILDIDDRIIDNTSDTLPMRYNDCMLDVLKVLCAYRIPYHKIKKMGNNISQILEGCVLLTDESINKSCLSKKWNDSK